VGSDKVVLNEPFRQFLIENDGIGVGVPLSDEFLLDRPIEALADRIVLGGFDPTPPVLKLEVLDGFLEVQMELTPIVRLDVFEVLSDQEPQALEKVRCRERTVRRVHAREGEAGVPVDCREHVALVAIQPENDCVDADHEAGPPCCT
jgi:hypothetical protein